MKKLFVTNIALLSLIYCNDIELISSSLKNKMIKNNTYKDNCPVKIEDLRLLNIKYMNFNKKLEKGQLIVHKDIASNVVDIFDKLLQYKYPIKEMNLMYNYKGNDDLSMKNNNTSSFNCRLMTGSKTKWSKHSYGLAIDINPLQNPYVLRDGKTVLPKEGKKYIGANRIHINSQNQSDDKAILLENDYIVKLFKSYGWKWGGDWKTLKDYQHFEIKPKLKKSINLKKEKKQNVKKLFKKLKQSNKDLF